MCACGCSEGGICGKMAELAKRQATLRGNLWPSQFGGSTWNKPLGASYKSAGSAGAGGSGIACACKPKNKPLGASAPAGFSTEQWASLTPEQQSLYIKGDQEQQRAIRDAVVSGVGRALDLVFAGIKAAEAAKDRETEIAREQMRLANEREIARIQAQRDIALAQAGVSPTTSAGSKTSTPAPAPTTTTASSGSGGGAAIAIGLGLLWLLGGKL